MGKPPLLVLTASCCNWKYAKNWHFLKLSLTKDLISSKEYDF